MIPPLKKCQVPGFRYRAAAVRGPERKAADRQKQRLRYIYIKVRRWCTPQTPACKIARRPRLRQVGHIVE